MVLRGRLAPLPEWAKAAVIYATLENVVGECLFRCAQLLANFQAVQQAQALLDEFELARLNGKVALGEGNRLFARVAVLSDQIASIASEHEILNLALATLPVGDQFRDATKMMPDFVTRGLAGLDGTLDGGQKILPPCIAKRFLQIPGEPELQIDSVGVGLGQSVKLALHLKKEFLVHNLEERWMLGLDFG
jgi:hypothetical protein